MASDVVGFLQRLVRVRSLSGNEEDLAGLVKDELSSLGVDQVWIDKVGNVIAKVSGTGRGPILFDAHMDTVPEGDSTNWRINPFSGGLINGHVYGRGSVDMKSGLAAIVHSIKLVKEGFPDLVYAFVVHEEDHEGFGVRHVIESTSKPKLVVLGEPTSLNLARGHRGRAELIVELRGKTAHSSMPELGENCLDTLCDYMKELKGLDMPYHSVLGPASIAAVNVEVSPGVIPIIPDRCQLLLDRRTLPRESREDLERQLGGTIVKRILRCYTGYEEEVEAWFPAWVNKDSDLVKLTGRLGTDMIIWRFGTDGSYTAGELGIPTIGYGPGDQEMAHRPNEMVSIGEVERAVRGYAEIIEWFSSWFDRTDRLNQSVASH